MNTRTCRRGRVLFRELLLPRSGYADMSRRLKTPRSEGKTPVLTHDGYAEARQSAERECECQALPCAGSIQHEFVDSDHSGGTTWRAFRREASPPCISATAGGHPARFLENTWP